MFALTVDERWRRRDVMVSYRNGRSAGALATASWLSERGLWISPRTPWDVSISLGHSRDSSRDNSRDSSRDSSREVVGAPLPATETRLRIAVASTEWGFCFCHRSGASWIRVIDVPSVHERDDFALRARVPPLRELGLLVRALEARHRIRFRREHAEIRSTVPDSEAAIRAWVAEL